MSEPDKIRAAAAALIPQIVAERESKLAEFRREHEADKASFNFRCELHGGFLAVFMTRGPKPTTEYYCWLGVKPTNKIVTAINLSTSRIFHLSLGSEPALDGTVTFNLARNEVHEVYPAISNKHQMIEIDQVTQQHGQVYWGGGSADVLSGMHVKDCPRRAADDSVYFVGPGVKLFAPAGLGQSMYDTILSALGSEGSLSVAA